MTVDSVCIVRISLLPVGVSVGKSVSSNTLYNNPFDKVNVEIIFRFETSSND